MRHGPRYWMASLTIGMALTLTACGGGGTTTGGQAAAGPTTLELSTDGENNAYKPTTLSAPAGQQVTLKFTNAASGLQHNWVLLKGGDDVATTVAQEGTAAGPEKGYLPADTANIIASTRVLNPKESGEVSFAAPAAGTYTFICTVPGHLQLGMKGTLTTS